MDSDARTPRDLFRKRAAQPGVRDYCITDLVTWAVPPGMRTEQMNGSLERFVRDVAPRVKAAAAAA